MESALVAADDVPALLLDLGVADAGESVEVEILTGGVSSSVFRAQVGDRSVVLKQALPQLQVAREWLSDPSRSSVECRAARYLFAILPGQVPAVIAEDSARHLFVMVAAPKGSRTWKQEMLEGTFDLKVASTAGSMLGQIHEKSSTNPTLPDEFADKQFFRELRVDAYIREVGRRHPSILPEAELWATQLDHGGVCLVHADFSPKNLLVSPDRQVLLVDHEVAHWGDPSFDLAFFMTHLLAKSLRHPDALHALGVTLDAYLEAAPTMWRVVDESGQLLGLMMLARVDGKSPLEYLTEPEREAFRRAALEFIHDPPASLKNAPSQMESVR